MNDDVGAILKRPKQNRRRHRVINDQRDAMLVRNARQAFDVRNVSSGIPDALAINRARILVDHFFDVFRLITRRESPADSALRQNVLDECVARAVELRRSNNVCAGLGDIHQRIFDRGHSRTDAECFNAAFKRRNALLEHRVGRIADARVDVSDDFVIKQSSAVRRIVEFKRDGLINRHRHRFRGGVAFVSDMQRDCFRFHRSVLGIPGARTRQNPRAITLPYQSFS